MVTIRDIADHLGVGKSTVQRALMGHAGISATTRDRVLKAAQDLGYRPDPLYSILGSQNRQSRSHPLAIAYLDRDEASKAGVSGLAAARERGHQLGYTVDHVRPDALDAGKRMMDVLYHRGYTGVIIGRLRPTDHAAVLADTHLPIVCCGRINPLPLHTVQPDIVQMVRLAWAKMWEAGYRRIGAALGTHQPVIADDWERYGTILACQQETLARKDHIPPLEESIFDKEALLAWYRKHQPEAVLGFRVGQYYDLSDAGIDMSRVPFVSLHTVELDGPVRMTGIREAKETIPRQVVSLLDQLIRHRDIGIPAEPLRILVPGDWLAGDTMPDKVVTKPSVKPKRS